MDMYKQNLWLDQEQPNLGYADVKLNIVCMPPLACLHTLSLCVYYDLYDKNLVSRRCHVGNTCYPWNTEVKQHSAR